MGKDLTLYETMDKLDQSFPVIIHKDTLSKKDRKEHFKCHWHEKIEFLYFTKGRTAIRCNSCEYTLKAGELLIVNSNELHQGRCISNVSEYYCVIVDTTLFQSRFVDVCEAKYINPISQNRILLKNKIGNDREAVRCITGVIREYETKAVGYELAIKAYIYSLLAHLLRNHIRIVLTPREYDMRMRNLKLLNGILQYMEVHYRERLTIDLLSSMANLSRFHFCRIFKDVTGKPPGEYLNTLRLNKAEGMLRDGGVNITEAALACGFNDTNYFSRLFKRHKRATPSSVLRAARET